MLKKVIQSSEANIIHAEEVTIYFEDTTTWYRLVAQPVFPATREH